MTIRASSKSRGRNAMNKERVLLLERLRTIVCPNPVPTRDEAHALRQASKWPPPNAPKTAPRIPAP